MKDNKEFSGAIIDAWITTSFEKRKLIFQTKLTLDSELILRHGEASITSSEANRQVFVAS